jgi:hypothetical protein
MFEFVVESYAPPQTASTLAAGVGELAAAAAQASAPGAEVRLLGAVLLPAEETCLYLYQAPSADAVRAAAGRAGQHLERISDAVLIRPSQTGARAPAPDTPTNP